MTRSNARVLIQQLSVRDRESTKALYSSCIPLAFELEGLSNLQSVISEEIIFKHRLIDESLDSKTSSTLFYVAKINDDVIGAISLGPCGKEILDCTKNEWADLKELGSLYVVNLFQNQGIGSLLIQSVITELNKRGVKDFCLDSGYQHAQKKWIRKFGYPTMIVKDYWGKGLDHMLWKINLNEMNK